jgi:hypothetical protein
LHCAPFRLVLKRDLAIAALNKIAKKLVRTPAKSAKSLKFS